MRRRFACRRMPSGWHCGVQSATDCATGLPNDSATFNNDHMHQLIDTADRKLFKQIQLSHHCLNSLFFQALAFLIPAIHLDPEDNSCFPAVIPASASSICSRREQSLWGCSVFLQAGCLSVVQDNQPTTAKHQRDITTVTLNNTIFKQLYRNQEKFADFSK